MKTDPLDQARRDRLGRHHGATLMSVRSGGVVVINEIDAKNVGVLIGCRGSGEVTWKRYERAEMSFREAIKEIEAWNKTAHQEVLT